MSKMFVKSGDTVMVLSGKSKGVKGEVVAVSPAEGKVIVKKVNVVTWASLAVLLKLNQLFMHQKYSSYVLNVAKLHA